MSRVLANQQYVSQVPTNVQYVSGQPQIISSVQQQPQFVSSVQQQPAYVSSIGQGASYGVAVQNQGAYVSSVGQGASYGYSLGNQASYGVAVQQQPVVQQIIEQPVVAQQQLVQQVVEGPPQSQGPINTTVVQGQTQLGESKFEYIPKEKVWVEYEAVQSQELVPKEVKLTDHYAVEHITEYHPKVYQDTYVDYHPVERNQERVEYQQVVKKLTHPMVQSEITETILQTIPGPQTLIESKSQIIETGNQQNLNSVQRIQQSTVSQVVQQPQLVSQVVQQPTASLIQGSSFAQGAQFVQGAQYASGANFVTGSRVVSPSVQYVQQPQLVASRVIQQPIVGTTVVNPSVPITGSRVVIQ